MRWRWRGQGAGCERGPAGAARACPPPRSPSLAICARLASTRNAPRCTCPARGVRQASSRLVPITCRAMASPPQQPQGPAPDASTSSTSQGGFEVKIKQWHAVASWTWDAGARRAASDERRPRAPRSSVPHFLPPPNPLTRLPPLQATMCAASAACPSTAAPPTASSPATTRPWCGGSAPTPFTCSASTGKGGGCLRLRVLARMQPHVRARLACHCLTPHPAHTRTTTTRWLVSQSEQKCPFCRRPWEFKAADTDEVSD